MPINQENVTNNHEKTVNTSRSSRTETIKSAKKDIRTATRSIFRHLKQNMNLAREVLRYEEEPNRTFAINKVKASLGGVNGTLDIEDREIQFVHTEAHRKRLKRTEKSVSD